MLNRRTVGKRARVFFEGAFGTFRSFIEGTICRVRRGKRWLYGISMDGIFIPRRSDFRHIQLINP